MSHNELLTRLNLSDVGSVFKARKNLGLSSGDVMPMLARDYGISGNGTDQSTAWNDLVDDIPTEGAVVYLPSGSIVVSGGVDRLKGRTNIVFIGQGGMGAGSTTRTIVRANTASGSRIFDCRDSVGICFIGIFFYQMNAGFGGYMIDYGVESVGVTSGTSLMELGDCTVLNNGTSSSAGINLYGSTQGVFPRVTVGGAGPAVQLQDVAGVGFCNSHQFIGWSILSAGTHYPFKGSGEGLTFLGGNLQPSSSDHKLRLIQTSANQDFREIGIFGLTAYDAGAGGYAMMDFKRGEALNVMSNMLGGYNAAGTYQVQLGGGTGGVRGFNISGNSFRGGDYSINPAGAVGSGTHGQKGVIAGNSTFGGLLLPGTAGLDSVELGPNYIEGFPNALGSHKQIIGIPTSSAGLPTGAWYSNAGVVTVA